MHWAENKESSANAVMSFRFAEALSRAPIRTQRLRLSKISRLYDKRADGVWLGGLHGSEGKTQLWIDDVYMHTSRVCSSEHRTMTGLTGLT